MPVPVDTVGRHPDRDIRRKHPIHVRQKFIDRERHLVRGDARQVGLAFFEIEDVFGQIGNDPLCVVDGIDEVVWIAAAGILFERVAGTTHITLAGLEGALVKIDECLDERLAVAGEAKGRRHPAIVGVFLDPPGG